MFSLFHALFKKDYFDGDKRKPRSLRNGQLETIDSTLAEHIEVFSNQSAASVLSSVTDIRKSGQQLFVHCHPPNYLECVSVAGGQWPAVAIQTRTVQTKRAPRAMWPL